MIMYKKWNYRENHPGGQQLLEFNYINQSLHQKVTVYRNLIKNLQLNRVLTS